MKYDIIIIGAGIVGLAMAGALRQTGLRIAMVDRQPPKDEFYSTVESLTLSEKRFSALTLTSQKILEKIGAWQLIPSEKLSPFRKMYVWDAIGNGNIGFDSAEMNESELGYILENDVIQTALYNSLKDCTDITFISPAELKAIKDSTITLDNDQTFTTKLLIGADGANSKVRELAAIEMKIADYGHSALICNVQTSLPHQQTAWQRFLASGPLAFLPLANPYESSIVWSTNPKEAEELSQLPDDAFKERLKNAFDQRLGVIEEISKRAVFPLQMRHANHYIKPNLALIGDAAHTIHPLAGQGLNLGLLDAACLSQIITEALGQKRDFSSYATLRRYERWRKSENTVMMTFVEGIKRLYSEGPTITRKLANLGLNLTNRFAPLKKFLIKSAEGGC